MKNFPAALACGLVLGLAALTQAGEVKVKGVHLCCPMCVRIVGDTLKDVDGVSGAQCDRDEKAVTFTAKDDKAAEAGIKALAEAGFYGKATHGDKEVKFPESGAKKGDKSDSLTLTQVHNCCGACVRVIEKVLREVDGVQDVKVERDKALGTVTVTGKGIEAAAAVKALNDEGLFGKLKS